MRTLKVMLKIADSMINDEDTEGLRKLCEDYENYIIAFEYKNQKELEEIKELEKRIELPLKSLFTVWAIEVRAMQKVSRTYYTKEWKETLTEETTEDLLADDEDNYNLSVYWSESFKEIEDMLKNNYNYLLKKYQAKDFTIDSIY